MGDWYIVKNITDVYICTGCDEQKDYLCNMDLFTSLFKADGRIWREEPGSGIKVQQIFKQLRFHDHLHFTFV